MAKLMYSTNTLHVSDIHLGSVITKLNEFYKILNYLKDERLILLGDIFEKYSRDQLGFISFLKKFLAKNTASKDT